MAKKKRVPKYMLKPVQKQTVTSKSGNPEKSLSLDVPLFKNGAPLLDGQGNMVRENVTEIYTWNQDHRTTLKANKGCWGIPESIELLMFEGCRRNGLFKKWKQETHMGWNVLYDKGQAQVKALSMYRGVMRPYPHPISAEAIEGFAAYRGCQAGCNYAEVFEVALRRL